MHACVSNTKLQLTCPTASGSRCTPPLSPACAHLDLQGDQCCLYSTVRYACLNMAFLWLSDIGISALAKMSLWGCKVLSPYQHAKLQLASYPYKMDLQEVCKALEEQASSPIMVSHALRSPQLSSPQGHGPLPLPIRSCAFIHCRRISHHTAWGGLASPQREDMPA